MFETKSKLLILVTLKSACVVADSKGLKKHIEIVEQRYNDLVNLQTWTADKGYDVDELREEINDKF